MILFKKGNNLGQECKMADNAKIYVQVEMGEIQVLSRKNLFFFTFPNCNYGRKLVAYAPTNFFVRNSMLNNFYLKHFFDTTHTFGNTEH